MPSRPDSVCGSASSTRPDRSPPAISAAAVSIRVSGRSPSRTTDAAPAPSSSSTSTVTPASMSSSWSPVCSTSRSDTRDHGDAAGRRASGTAITRQSARRRRPARCTARVAGPCAGPSPSGRASAGPASAVELRDRVQRAVGAVDVDHLVGAEPHGARARRGRRGLGCGRTAPANGRVMPLQLVVDPVDAGSCGAAPGPATSATIRATAASAATTSTIRERSVQAPAQPPGAAGAAARPRRGRRSLLAAARQPQRVPDAAYGVDQRRIRSCRSCGAGSRRRTRRSGRRHRSRSFHTRSRICALLTTRPALVSRYRSRLNSVGDRSISLPPRRTSCASSSISRSA